MSFPEKTIFFTLLFLFMFGGHWMYMKLDDAYMGRVEDSLGSLDAKDKYTIYLKQNQIWIIPTTSLFIGLLTASLVSV